MAVRLSSNRIGEISQHGVVVDANVLVLVFSEAASYSETVRRDEYARAIKDAYKAGKTLFVDFVIVSEMVNRILRIGHESHLEMYGLARKDFPFKRFRDDESSHERRESAAESLEQVLTFCQVTNHSHTRAALASLAATVKDGTCDINDFHIAMLCRKSDYVLLTDDRDFGTFHDLNIMTANPRLLT